MPSGGSGLGYALPLAILMVAGPMTPTPVAAMQYNRLASSPKMEYVDAPVENIADIPVYQAPQEPQKKNKVVCSNGDIILRDKGSISIRLTGYSTDDNDSTFEKMFLYYKNLEKNTSYRLKAKLFAFCPTPRADGKYIVLIGVEGDTQIRIAALPFQFGDILKKAVPSDERNNHAVKILEIKELDNLYGEGFVDKVLPIEEFIPDAQDKCVATGD